MPRAARFTLPGYPHHVTQRGNRRQQTFFQTQDYADYLDRLRGACERFGVACWAYCLMPNHVHLILEPRDESGLAAALKQTHQSCTRRINARVGWTGCLWRGRFSSCAMDEGQRKNGNRHHYRAGSVRPYQRKLVPVPVNLAR